MKRRVLITVNPDIVRRRNRTTLRAFLTEMDKHFELLVIPIDSYDFKRGTVQAFKRRAGGTFERIGSVEPSGDLWIVYTDGYYLDSKRFGFGLRRDYFAAQVEFHQGHLAKGSVRRIVNNPEAESWTLKTWLTTLNFKKTRVIPTYQFSSIDLLHDFQRDEQVIVAKPVWGGGAMEVQKLEDEASVKRFGRTLEKRSDRDLSDYCFQLYRQGDEKRLWFAGGKFVAGRKFVGRDTPWESDVDCRPVRYDHRAGAGFIRDVNAAKQLCTLSGISVGAIDFIGDEINEINGGGTAMTTMDRGRIFVDARPAFIEYFRKIAR